MRPILLTLVLASAGLTAGPVNRVFQYGTTETVQDMNEMATAIRSIMDVRQLSVDEAQRTLTMAGDATQMEAAEWLFNELDKPANRPPVTLGAADPAVHEYRIPGGGEDTIRVLYAPNTVNVQQFQEIATATRSVTMIRRVFTYNTPRAIVARGTTAQIAMAAWLIPNLDGKLASAHLDYPNPTNPDDVLRILYLPHTATIKDFQEAAVNVRAIGDIRSLFTYNAPRAVVLRGTPAQAAVATWLANLLDQPPTAPKVNPEYQIPGEIEGMVQIFYLPKSQTVADLQNTAKTVRTKTGARWTMTYNAARALTVRGTATQIAAAEQLLAQPQ